MDNAFVEPNTRADTTLNICHKIIDNVSWNFKIATNYEGTPPSGAGGAWAFILGGASVSRPVAQQRRVGRERGRQRDWNSTNGHLSDSRRTSGKRNGGERGGVRRPFYSCPSQARSTFVDCSRKTG